MIDRQYLYLLKRFHRVGFKSAVIGGGAVRDDFFKRSPKDVDFFICDPEVSDESIKLVDYNDEDYTATSIDSDIIYSILDSENYLVEEMALEDMDDYDETYISSIWNLVPFNQSAPSQLIFITEPPVEYVEKHFDIGLCMCYCDGIKLHYTHNFIKDYRNKTLTICGVLNEVEFEYSITHHVQRLKPKFPGYAVKVAPELEEFLTPSLRKYL